MSSISESLEESGLFIWTSLFYASVQGRELDLHEQFLEHWFAVSASSSVCYTLWSWIFFSWVYLQPRDKARALDPWSWSPLLTVEIHGNFRRLSSSESQSRCSNDACERKVFIVEQDIIHATTNARVRLPKHVGLVITIKHFAWSKQSITLHNRLGHYCSCDKTEGMEISIANETIARTELTGGIIIPSNTTPGI